MRLDEALSDVDVIRGQLDKLPTVTCYRAATIGVSGCLAILASVWQPDFFRSSSDPGLSFLLYWTCVASACVVVIAVEMGWRYLTTATARQRKTTRQSLMEFCPSLIVGAMLGLLFATQLRSHVALLPGLWAIIFGLGVLATINRLPRGGIWIAVHYFASGFLCMKLATDEQALASWTMASTFGIGQLWSAVILHFSSSKPCKENVIERNES
jgi:hypothetical protein